MVDPDQRNPGRRGNSLGAHHTRQHAANQAWASRHRNGIHLSQVQASRRQRALDAMVQPFGMGAGGKLRHNTAKRRMQRRLPLNDRGQNFSGRARRVAHDGCGGVVAAAFDTKDGQALHGHPLPKGLMAGNTADMAKQSRPPRFLLTRPAAQGDRFAAMLQDRFGKVEVIDSPLIAPVYLSPTLPAGPFAALIFTSEAGVEGYRRLCAASRPMACLAFCVGDRTADAARENGLTAVSAGGDAQALLALIAKRAQTGPMLYLHGQDLRVDLAEVLNCAGTETYSVVVYRQDAQPLTAEAHCALQQPHPLIVPLFSPRTARLLVQELVAVPAIAPLDIVAMSSAIAAELDGAIPRSLRVAQRPDAAAMLDAIARLLAPPRNA